MKNFVLIILSVSLVLKLSKSLKIDCDNPESIKEDRIHYCCKHPDGYQGVVDSCAKETGFKFIKHDEEAMVDITVDHAITGTCFGKCVFNKLEFMKGNDLDMTAVRAHFENKSKADPEYAKEMINAFDHCHGKSVENTAKFLSNPIFRQANAEFCDPKPAVILACVIREFFHNCPADRWAKTEECNTVLEFSKKCKDALTTI
ncbi:PREDICTED: general odorant-binding protein 66 [Bactrocera latifrons]|uniref:general odorant-binding protein 66 n=1 Tax=Bactrocera latifrons TaxID=174628 RepID=UPI0008DDCB52|nr:PREDICTED: general odorant-binding protein 66 [Bactrocera latifrons]